MIEFSHTPLDRLNQRCAQCLHKRSQSPCEPCRELAYRALCGGNDAAWDILLVHLWSFILRWIYAAQPELTPTVAEALGYRALWIFRSHFAHRVDLATNFPTFPVLLDVLYRCLWQVILN